MTDLTPPTSRGGIQPPRVEAASCCPRPVRRDGSPNTAVSAPQGAEASDQPAEILPAGKDPPKGGAPRGNTNALHHGAPFGNNNAVKHGFYSSAFTRAERKRLELELQGELNDEEECIRLVVRRYIDSMGDEKMGHDRYLLAIRALCLAFGRIESLDRTRRVIYDKQTTLDQVWEELKLIPPEED